MVTITCPHNSARHTDAQNTRPDGSATRYSTRPDAYCVRVCSLAIHMYILYSWDPCRLCMGAKAPTSLGACFPILAMPNALKRFTRMSQLACWPIRSEKIPRMTSDLNRAYWALPHVGQTLHQPAWKYVWDAAIGLVHLCFVGTMGLDAAQASKPMRPSGCTCQRWQ